MVDHKHTIMISKKVSSEIKNYTKIFNMILIFRIIGSRGRSHRDDK